MDPAVLAAIIAGGLALAGILAAKVLGSDDNQVKTLTTDLASLREDRREDRRELNALERKVNGMVARERARDDYILSLRKHIIDGNPPPPPPWPAVLVQDVAR